MAEPQIKYVSVNPEGKVKGPMGDSFREVQSFLEAGHRRVGLSGRWKDIEAHGYSIRKVEIRFMDLQ